MVRGVVAVLLGLSLAIAVIFGLEWAGQFIYPLPEGVNPNDAEYCSIAAWMSGTVTPMW